MDSSYYSMKNLKCSSTTKSARHIRVIHTTIRPERHINSVNNKSIYNNSSTKNHFELNTTIYPLRRSLSQQLQKNVWKDSNSIEHSTPDVLNNFSTQSKQKFSINLKNNYRSSSETRANIHEVPWSWLDRKGTTEDLWKKSKKRKRKYFSYYCCHCSYLCIFMSLCSGLLLAISIAAILVGLLTRTSNSSTTSTTTALTTIKGVTVLFGTNETIYGLWNTTAGSNSILSTPGSGIGNYNPIQTPQNIFDQNNGTKYTSYGICNQSSISLLQCGANTGFYLTFRRGTTLLTSIRFCTADTLPQRDPMAITIEGSNQPSSALLLGSSWTLIYNGSSGLDTDPGRYSFGVTLIISNNFVQYESYRLLVTSKRGLSNAVQYSGIEMFGY